MILCPHCNLRPVRSVHAKSCEECIRAAQTERRRAYANRTREHHRAVERALYSRKKGPNPKAAPVDTPQFMVGWNLGILPCQIQGIPAERLEDAIQRILDLRVTAAAVEGIPQAIREEVHRAVAEAKKS